jgi:hypothetical protein
LNNFYWQRPVRRKCEGQLVECLAPAHSESTRPRPHTDQVVSTRSGNALRDVLIGLAGNHNGGEKSIRVDKIPLERKLSSFGVHNVYPDNSALPSSLEQTANFPPRDAKDGPNFVLGFIFFVIQLSSPNGQQFVCCSYA